MASQDSWPGAVREFWNDIVAGDRFPRFVRISIAVVLVLATAWSVFMFRQMVVTMQGDEPPLPAGKAAVSQEIKQLDETAKGFRNAVLARTGSTQLAVIATAMARRPFMPSDPSGRREDPLEGLSGTPMIWVKAILLKGNDAVAVVDIDGFGEGIILKKGGSFAGGKGKAVSIKHDKVVVTWSGQQIEIPVDR